MIKIPYICGPLTELKPEIQADVKSFYTKLGTLCESLFGERAFVPHEHYDPIKNANFTPQEVDRAERAQVCENTSVLIACAIEPSWGSGIEVEMAFRSNVPVIILKPPKNISRLLRGNPAVFKIIEFETFMDALEKVAHADLSGLKLKE